MSNAWNWLNNKIPEATHLLKCYWSDSSGSIVSNSSNLLQGRNCFRKSTSFCDNHLCSLRTKTKWRERIMTWFTVKIRMLFSSFQTTIFCLSFWDMGGFLIKDMGDFNLLICEMKHRPLNQEQSHNNGCSRLSKRVHYKS